MRLPEEDEVLRYFAALSNSGRWGEGDEAGTLNLISAQKRLEAARLITTGEVVSLAWQIDTSALPGEFMAPVRLMIATGQGARVDDHDDTQSPERSRQGYAMEMLGMAYHGFSITHIDALSHHSFDGRLYNDFLVDSVVNGFQGARHLDVLPAGNIFTRGILIDVPRHRGVDWMPEGELLDPDELADILASGGVEVGEGDILLLRTGNGRHVKESGWDHMNSSPGPGGFHVANMPFFHDAGVAAIGADMPNDRNVSEYPSIRNPVHAVALTVLGMWIIDNCDLEALSEAAQRHGTIEFALAISAIPFAGATGSPINPTAIF